MYTSGKIIILCYMSDIKNWLKFEINADSSATDFFEKVFCKKFFAIQNDCKESDVVLPPGYGWIEAIPIKGVSYQSKYTTEWNEVEKSLDVILRHREKHYPELRKVYLYLKEVPPSYTKHSNEADGVIKKLESQGVEIIPFGGFGKFYVIYEEEKYVHLREYFEIKNDLASVLELAKKYLANLLIEEGWELLEIVKAKSEGLPKEQKFEFYRQYWNFKCLYNGYNNEIKYPNYHQEYFRAYNCYKDHPDAKRVLSVAYLDSGKYVEAETCLTELLSSDILNSKAYTNLLLLRHFKWESIESIIESLDVAYSNDPLVLKKIGDLAFIQKKISIAQSYYRLGYSKDSDNSLGDTIQYILILSDYVYTKYWTLNIDLEARNEYKFIAHLYESRRFLLEDKNFPIFAHIFNILWFINLEILKDKYNAVYFFRKSLAINFDATTSFNLGKLYNDKWEISEAKAIFEALWLNMDKHIHENVVQTVPILLSQIYFQEKDREKAENILVEYKLRFSEYFLPVTHKHVNVGFFNLKIAGWSKDELLTFVNSIIEEYPEEILYHMFAFEVTKDSSHLLKAYWLVNDTNHPHILDLASKLSMHGFTKEAFTLYKEHLRDLSMAEFTEDFIILGLNLGELSIVESTLENYGLHSGGQNDEFIVGYKAYIEERKGDYRGAIGIIESFPTYQKHVKLLIHKAHLHMLLYEKEKLCETVEVIIRHPNSYKLNSADLNNFLNAYSLVDRLGSIKFMYRYLQKPPESQALISRYVGWCMQCGILSAQKHAFVDQESVVVIKELKTWVLSKLILDGYSKGASVDRVIDERDPIFEGLIGKKLWDTLTNLFWPALLEDRIYEITQIIDKYWFYFQEYAWKRTEESWAFQRFPIDPENPIQGLQNILGINKQKAEDKQKMLEDLRKQWLLTFGIVSQVLSKSYLETYEVMTNGGNLNFQSEIIQQNYDWCKNFIIDITWILSIFELWIEQLIAEGCNIYISQSSLDYFIKEMYETEYSELKHAGYLWLNTEDKLVYEENTVEKRDNLEQRVKNIVMWLKRYTKVQKAKTLLDRWELGQLLEFEFADTLQIAKENNLWLYSDDIVLQRLARGKDYSVRSFWTETMLLLLLWGQDITGDHFDSLKNKLSVMKFTNLSSKTSKDF